MSHDEDEDLEDGFKGGSAEGDEPLDDMPEDLDFGLDEEDPDHDK
jgi:hypothetical protein